MATKEWYVKQYGTVNLGGREHYLEDGDTWVDLETDEPFRGKGFDTEEVYHSGTGGDHKKAPMTNQGYAQTEIVADMMRNQGYNQQTTDGEGYFGRTLGVVSNEDNNQKLANKLYSEGLVNPTAYTSEDDMNTYLSGQATRAMLGEEAKTGHYGNMRDLLENSRAFDKYTPKRSAVNEREFAGAPWSFNSVMYRHDDRSIDNQANSPLVSSFASGMDAMQQGFWGAVEMAGNKVGSDYLEQVGGDNVEANQQVIDNAPVWVEDITKIDSLSKFGDWTAGALGGSMPYFLLMAGGFVPGMQIPVGTAMATTFAGGTWNGMEGDNSKKDAGIAVSTGIFMAALERLGGKAVLGIKAKLKKDIKEGNVSTSTLDKGLKDLIMKYAREKKIPAKDARAAILNGINAEATLLLKDIGANKDIWSWYAGRVGKGAAAGFGGEATTETLQELSQYLGSAYGSEAGKFEFDQEQLNKTLLNSAVAGGILGGGIHGGKTALTAESPVSTSVRMADWSRKVAEKFEEEGMLDMHDVLAKASAANLNEGKPFINPETQQWQYPSDKIKNKEYIDSLIETYKEDEKKKTLLGKAKDILGDSEWIATRYNVLKRRLGEKGLLSPTFLSEMEFSGWVDGRTTQGQTIKQVLHELEGMQHQKIRDIADGVRKELGTKDTHNSRADAWSMLIEYQKFINEGKEQKDLPADLKEIQQALTAGLKGIRGLESYQRKFLQRISVNPSGKEGHTLTQRNISNSKVREGKDSFVEVLRKHWGMTKEEALEEYENFEEAPDGYDAQEYQATNFLSKKPSQLKRGIDYSSDTFKDFQEETSYESAMVRSTEISRFTSDMIALGHQGQGLHSRLIQMEKEFTRANGAEWTAKHMPEIANSIVNQHLAHRGDYHKIESEAVRHATSNLGSMMALAYMPLALFASFPELGIAFLDADREMFLKAAKRASKLGAQSLAAQMRKVADLENLATPEYDAALKVMRERGMLEPEFGVGHVVDAEVSADRRNWLQREVMPAFYKLSGLTSFTTMVRIVRDGFANDYIDKHLNIVEMAYRKRIAATQNNAEYAELEENGSAYYKFNNLEANSFKRLRELGLDPQDIAQRRLQLFDDYENFKKIVGDDTVSFQEFLDQVEDTSAERVATAINLARANFVDAALVNPDAGKRPLLYSDGRYRLLMIFQGYLSTFSSTIIKPMLKKLAGQGTPAEQINTAMVMMTMIGLGFLGQAMKDEMKYGDTPSWLTDAEYLQRGVQASGLMGQTERVFNLFFPLYHSKEDTVADKAWAEVGPLAGTIDSLAKGFDWASEGEWEKALNKFLKVAPGGVLTQQRKAIAEAIAGE